MPRGFTRRKQMIILKRDMLAIIMSGSTHVLNRNGKEAFVYFETQDRAHMLLDDGETRIGLWRLLDDGYEVDWDNGATGRWKLEYEAGSVTYVNQDRDLRVPMIGVLFGNPQNLPR